MHKARAVSRRRFLIGMVTALGGSALVRSLLQGDMSAVVAGEADLQPQAYLPYVARRHILYAVPHPGKVVQIRNAAATHWTGEADYWNHLDQTAVDAMVELGLLELTGATTVIEAWQQLIPDYRPGQKVAIKVNFNNTRVCDSSSPVIDALMEPVNAVAKGLIQMGVAPLDICVYDAVRALPDRFVGADLYDLSFFDGWRLAVCRTEAGFTYEAGTQIQFSPPAGVTMPDEHVTDVLMNAAYLINMPIMKGGHPLAGVTLGFKNHFGSISACGGLHDYVDVVRAPEAYRTDYNPMVDMLLSPLIGGKTVLTIGDALFAARQFAQAPVPWTTFGAELPNSLFFATDPVAVDCVMHDLLAVEPGTSVPDGSNNYLRLAGEAGLGVYEEGNPWQEPFGSGYGSIEYTRIDM
jgi:uncharacterized protein (DUF362 family)